MREADRKPLYDPSGEAERFHGGISDGAYHYFGVHEERTEETYRYTFRLWAPHATTVHLLGDLADWNKGKPFRLLCDGVWELCLETKTCMGGTYYKYAIECQDGSVLLKGDPFAFYSETMGKTASIIPFRDDFSWSDGAFMKKRLATVCPKQRGFKPKIEHFYSAPLNIYEIHLGSWRRRVARDEEGASALLNYRELADKLAPYLADMGFTHCQLMPIMEHPYDGSLGYEVTGYYAPTSRYGTPDDFRYFVNKMHENGVGVLLDWMPTYFPKDEHGLHFFDGKSLYEYEAEAKRENRSVGTVFFDLEKPQVQSFLLSNAMFWLREYHVDGLTVDSSAWIDGEERVELDQATVSFLQKLNQAVQEEHPDALMITRDVSAPCPLTGYAENSLGFSFVLKTDWEEKIYRYVSAGPLERPRLHDILTDTPDASFAGSAILPLSHDGVMGGKRSVVDKCFGEYDDKFASMRTMLLYRMTVPGKKLTFMGTEFAQFREWDSERELEWFMTDYPRHIEMQRFVRAMNRLYLDNPALWEIDDTEDGFAWIHRDLADLSVISFTRREKKKGELVVVLNFGTEVRENFTVYVPRMGRYEEIFTTDRYEFGGKNRLNESAVRARFITDETGTKRSAVDISLPALGGVILKKQQN